MLSSDGGAEEVVGRAVRVGEFVSADPRLTLGITAAGVLTGVALIALITLSP